MYLTKLYRQNRFWFVVALLFAAGQLFINYKRGVELSPFYHYGMFSLPFQIKSEYEVTEVTVNGKLLQTKNYSPNDWDNIIMPVIQFQQQKRWNSLIYNTTIRRFLPVHDSTLYTNRIKTKDFNQWYKNHIISLLKLRDTNASVHYQIVSYHQNNSILSRK